MPAVDRGADVNRVATHRIAVTPLHAALFGRQVDAALLLIERGAGRCARARWVRLEAPAGRRCITRRAWVSAHSAAARSRRGSLRADEEGKTPLDVAIDANHHDVADVLRSRGGKQRHFF
jgi:ankyrin repeat protein